MYLKDGKSKSMYMPDRELMLALIINYVDVNFSIETVCDRIILQKIVYLYSCFNSDKYFSENDFCWYKNGAYNVDLTRFYYSLRAHCLYGIYDFIDYDLNITEVEACMKVKLLLNSSFRDLDRMERDCDWLELVASILFLTRCNLPKEVIIKFIKM